MITNRQIVLGIQDTVLSHPNIVTDHEGMAPIQQTMIVNSRIVADHRHRDKQFGIVSQ
jgi:hypothetical protein